MDPANKENPNNSPASWVQRLYSAIDTDSSSGNLTKQRLMEILWNEAVLGRIAPTDKQEQEDRVNRKSVVWQGDRNDPHLYWNILYSAQGVLEAIHHEYSIAPRNNYVDGVGVGISHLLSKDLSLLWPDPNIDPVKEALETMQERAKAELTSKSIEVRGHPVKERMKGTFKGLPVTVSGFTGDGGVAFTAADQTSHNELFDHFRNNSYAVAPWDIDPIQFHE